MLSVNNAVTLPHTKITSNSNILHCNVIDYMTTSTGAMFTQHGHDCTNAVVQIKNKISHS